MHVDIKPTLLLCVLWSLKRLRKEQEAELARLRSLAAQQEREDELARLKLQKVSSHAVTERLLGTPTAS